MWRRNVILALLIGLATAVVDAGAAEASCASAVVVEGRLLFGRGPIARASLPPIAGERRAVEPACNDASSDDPDREIRVRTLAGVPPEVAVVRRREAADLYVAEGSLVVSSAHPLHRAVYRRVKPPNPRRRPCRRDPRALRGTVTEEARASESALALRSGPRTILIEADARTRLTNRPPYETLNPGQRLVVGTSICRNRRVADTVAFAGATVAPEPYETDTAGALDVDARWLFALAWAVALLALLLAARRLGQDRR